MSIFSALPKGAIDNAAPDSRLPKLTGPSTGVFSIRVIRHRISENPDTEGNHLFFPELTCEVSDNPAIKADGVYVVGGIRCEPFEQFSQGPVAGAKKKINDNILRAVGTLKAIIAAALERPLDSITDEELGSYCVDNPDGLRGKRIVVITSPPIPSKSPGGKPWHRYEYTVASEEEVSRVKALARRAGTLPGEPAQARPNFGDPTPVGGADDDLPM